MNLRKEQIDDFLINRLPNMVNETLQPFAIDDSNSIREAMSKIEATVQETGSTIDQLSEDAPIKQRYFQLKKQLTEGADLEALETDVYSALYSFFSRYYVDGDFVSKRRYKEGVYAIPYEGEEVKLYWSNFEQYYIKTSENFKDYTFIHDGITVHFRLLDATTEQNNNKESKETKRTFMLFTEDEEKYPGIKAFEYNKENKELIVRFVYDIQTKFTGKADIRTVCVALMLAVMAFVAFQQLLLVVVNTADKNAKDPKEAIGSFGDINDPDYAEQVNGNFFVYDYEDQFFYKYMARK